MRSARLCGGLLALALCGCAGNRIAAVPPGLPVDAREMREALERVNGPDVPSRVMGRALLPDGARIDFAARAVPGRGLRFDATAGPWGKLLFSAACEEGVACEVYFPDRNEVRREEDGGLGAWLGALMSGRIPLLGAPSGAWTTPEGRRVLRAENPWGRWQLVLFPPDGDLPERILFGDPGAPASLEIVDLEFRREGETWYPVRWKVNGPGRGETLSLRFDAIRRGGEPGSPHFLGTAPPNARAAQGEGNATWKNMGLFWTPRP